MNDWTVQGIFKNKYGQWTAYITDWEGRTDEVPVSRWVGMIRNTIAPKAGGKSWGYIRIYDVVHTTPFPSYQAAAAQIEETLGRDERLIAVQELDESDAGFLFVGHDVLHEVATDNDYRV